MVNKQLSIETYERNNKYYEKLMEHFEVTDEASKVIREEIAKQRSRLEALKEFVDVKEVSKKEESIIMDVIEFHSSCRLFHGIYINPKDFHKVIIIITDNFLVDRVEEVKKPFLRVVK